MKILVSTLFAVVPALVLLRHFYRQDIFPEPRSVLVKTFFLGVLATILTVIVNLPLRFILADIRSFFWLAILVSFICAGLIEEFSKLCVIKGYSARKSAFDEPMDGVVYGAAASLGFAALENILYVYRGGWSTALSRAFTAVPVHACLGAILGYYVGQAQFADKSRGLVRKGFFLAVLMHGLYDFLILYPRGAMFTTLAGSGTITRTQIYLFAILGWAGPLVVVLALVIWVKRIVSRLKHEQREALMDSGKWFRVVGRSPRCGP